MCLYIQILGSISSMKEWREGEGRKEGREGERGEEKEEGERGRGEEKGENIKTQSEIVIHIYNSNNRLRREDWEFEGNLDYI